MTRSVNAMRMDMDPPSPRPRPVSGPLREDTRNPREEMVIGNRAAVFLQALGAFRRGDLKHYRDLMTRHKELKK